MILLLLLLGKELEGLLFACEIGRLVVALELLTSEPVVLADIVSRCDRSRRSETPV